MWLEDWQEGLPERGHDYDAAWDYETDESPKLVRDVERIVKQLKTRLLPAIRLFRDFDVAFDMPRDENKAEEFARVWHYDRRPTNFWHSA